jgi:hypothetical protein
MDNDAMWDPRPRIGPPEASPDAGPPDVSPLLVLVELSGDAAGSPAEALRLARSLEGFEVDEDYGVVPMGGGDSYIVQGRLDDERARERIAARPEVEKVWRSTPIAPF